MTAFGVGGGIGFMYALFRYRDAPHPLLTLVCQHHPEPWAPAILDRLGVEYTAVTGKRELGRLLAAETAMILPVARGIVPWLGADAQTEREEHIVLALPEGDHARIFDGTGDHARLSKTEIAEGYATTRRKHAVITVADGADLNEDLRPAVMAGLRTTVSGMTEPVLGNSFDVNLGLSGLHRWAERVVAPGADGWRQVFRDSDVWRRRLAECIDREYTAPTAGRPLFARLLRQYPFADAAGYFERSAEHWRSIALGAAGGSLGFDELARHVEAIADEEAAGISALRAMLAPSSSASSARDHGGGAVTRSPSGVRTSRSG